MKTNEKVKAYNNFVNTLANAKRQLAFLYEVDLKSNDSVLFINSTIFAKLLSLIESIAFSKFVLNKKYTYENTTRILFNFIDKKHA